tara:strand:+ start:660 stop:839 length:180 start_codon:yes stop_codon:yes gene_type:complete
MKVEEKVNFSLFGVVYEAKLVEKQDNREWKVEFEGLIYPNCKVYRKRPKTKPPVWYIIS